MEPIELIGFDNPKSSKLKGVPVSELDPELITKLRMHGIIPVDDQYYTDSKGNYYGLPSPERLALEQLANALKNNTDGRKL